MKITEEEQEILYQLRLIAIEAKYEAECFALKQKATQADYESALLKLYLKYGLSPKDRINEATGVIQAQEEREKTDGQESSNTDHE